MLDPDIEIAVSCKYCGFRIPFTVKEFEENPHFKCPNCKHLVMIDKSDVTKHLGDIEFLMSSVFGPNDRHKLHSLVVHKKHP
jgi:hypothetical protein